MPHWRVFYHFVWTTKYRLPLITPEIEAVLFKMLYQQAQEMYCPLFHVNGIEDHIHILTAFRPSIAPSDFVKQLKGSSSRHIELTFGEPFAWQKGFGIYSVSESHVERIKQYVINQKQHHSDNTLIDRLESSDDHNSGPPSQ